MDIYGPDIVITAGGGTVNITPVSPLVGPVVTHYFIRGATTLGASQVIQYDPAATPKKYESYVFHRMNKVNLGGNTFTIFGTVLTQDQLLKECEIFVMWTGSAWMFNLFMDDSELPSGVSGTKEIVLTGSTGTVNIDVGIDPNYIILTGSDTLAAGIVFNLIGVPKDGMSVHFDYRATMVASGGNTIKLSNTVLTSEQALTGKSMVQASYELATTAWVDNLFPNRAGATDDIWERGTGANSAQIKGAGNNASGDNSVAEGISTTARGAGSHSECASTVASGATSHAEGTSTTASGYGSHSEGTSTVASGLDAHAEGTETKASGTSSHAEGQQSVSHLESSRAFGSGQFNIKGDSQILDIILKKITTNNAPAALLDVALNDGIVIPTDSIIQFRCRYVAHVTGGLSGVAGDASEQDIQFSVQNKAGTLTLLTTGKATIANLNTVSGNIVYDLPSTINGLTVTCIPGIVGTKIKFIVTGVAATDIQHNIYVSMIINGRNAFSI